MNTRIKGSLVVGMALVLSAVLLSRYAAPQQQNATNPAETVAETNDTVAGQSVRQYVPVTDSDNDGTPDWQELLAQTEPLERTEPEPYTPPETMTGQFTVNFFQRYIRNEQFGTAGGNPATLVSEASADLINQTEAEQYTETDFTAFSATGDDVRRYANEVADIALRYPLPANDENELTIVERAVTNNDPSELARLTPKREAYENMTRDMLAVSVPNRFLPIHRDLTNAYQQMADTVGGMQYVLDDPLQALIFIQRYQADVDALGNAFGNLFLAANAATNFDATDRVYDIVKFE